MGCGASKQCALASTPGAEVQEVAPDGRQESRQESLKVYQLTTENVQTFVQVRAWRERPGGEHPQRGQAITNMP